MEYIHNLAAELPVPDGLGVRISGFHPDGPGSIPGLGGLFFAFEVSCLDRFRLRTKSDIQ